MTITILKNQILVIKFKDRHTFWEQFFSVFVTVFTILLY